MISLKGTLSLALVLLLPLWVLSQEKVDYRLIVFEGSDWCSNCLRLEKNVLSQAAFDQYRQSKSMEIERIDFPQRNKQDKATREYNANIAEQYGFQGIFPTVILVNKSDGGVFNIPYSKQDVDQFISLIENTLAQ